MRTVLFNCFKFIGQTCLDDGLTNIANKNVMTANGWTVDVYYSNDTPNNWYSSNCNSGTFYGYCYGNYIGSVTASFKGSGKATLDFGNCHTAGVTKAYLNGKEIAQASTLTMSKEVTFTYRPGYILKLDEQKHGIIQLNSLKLECNDRDI